MKCVSIALPARANATVNVPTLPINIEIEMIIGIGNPGADYAFTNGFFTGTPPKTVVSDWTATLSINGGLWMD